jgi:hypothetical protein
MTRKLSAITLIAALAASAAAIQVRAAGDKIAFPENFASGVMYTTVDRADNKRYLELFTAPAALDAAKKGEPLPSGTVITIVNYNAQVDAQGNPVKDANGRFVKGSLIGYGVMEKRTGWGTEYPPEIRNGEWEYQAFTAEKKVNEKANLTGCFQCHKPLPSSQDYVYSYDKMKTATK